MKGKSKHTKRAKSNQTLRMRGLSVRDVVLPWDSKEEFERLHRELTAELSPHGRMEEDIVLDVAILRWRKYQLAKWRRTAALKDPFFIELMESGKTSWSGIRKYLREQYEDSKTIRGSIRNALLKRMDDAEELAGKLMEETEKEKVEVTHQKLSGITKLISEHLTPLLEDIDAGSSAEKTFEQAYLPESLERVLKCEAAIDSQIGKLLARLVNLKEYKRVYGAHMLEPPMIKSPPTVTELAP
ncbi:MAG: hypothetical protein JOZ35_06485 [Hyphomicrobiales bacterium]|jgi:hypothetical protein|nr:hypothetical protein [Hyphomicrobiales bacterium]MBV8286549.1 hypothetical protein [Hyphomicrobiales bacterium]MBV8320316.1 hypothetical protein [Hyphomicrobiales bacterium]MBV8422432.1 hypothetical protein [Hyphomicrobiales bacterium]